MIRINLNKFHISLMCCAAILSLALPSVASAENEVSFYKTWAFISDDQIDKSLENFPSYGSDHENNGDYGYGLRYLYWTDANIGLGLDYNSYGFSGLPDADTLELHDWSVLGLYRLSTYSSFEPYLGAGLGLRMIEQTAYVDEEDGGYGASYSPTFNLTGLAGSYYRFNDTFSLFGELRLDYAGSPEANDDSDVSGEFPSMFTPGINMGVALSF